MAEDLEKSFPRGGTFSSSKKSKNKSQKITQQKKKNSKSVSEKPLVKDDQLKSEEVDDLDRLARAEDKKAQRVNVHYLSFKNIKKGMLVLGCVMEIQAHKLIVSLPNMLTGEIAIKELPPAFARLYENELLTDSIEAVSLLLDLFEIGQLLVCGVSQIDTHSKTIHLTLNPSLINSKCEVSKLLPGMHISGCVKSIEDHGYIIDIGNNAVNAFIPNLNQGSNTALKLHQVIRCTVVQVKSSGRILVLSADSKRLDKPLEKEFLGDTLDCLYPGTVVMFKQVASKRDGKIGKVGEFYSSVSLLHSSSKQSRIKADNSDEENANPQSKKRQLEDGITEPKKKRKVDLFKFACTPLVDRCLTPACVLFALHKSAALVLNSSVWEDEQRTKRNLDYKEQYRIGDKYSVNVLDKVSDLGLVCQLHKNGPFGIVGVNNISDDFRVSLDDIKLQEQIKVRIIGNVSLDGVIELSAKQSVYDAPYLHVDDVQPGDKVSAKVVSISKAGLEVVLGSHQDKKFVSCPVSAFIPSFHMSEINLKHPEKVFKVNDLLRCRVLNVDSEHKLVTLTNKQTLVQSDLPAVHDYKQVNIGDVIHVYVKAIKEQGCIVGLYDNVKGFVPKSEINLPPTSSSIRQEYHPGQVVRGRVCACNPRQSKLVMSFYLEDKREDQS